MQPRPRKLGQHLQVWANEIIHPFNLYQSICIKKGNYSWIIPSLFLSSYFTSLELGNFFYIDMCLKTLCLWNFILVMQGSSTRSTISLLLLYKFQTIILTRERAGKILNKSWDSSMFPCPQMVRWSDVTNPWDVKVFLLTELYDNKVKWTVNRLIQLLPCSKVRHPENRWLADAQTAQTQQKARSRAHSSSCRSSLCCHP